MEKRENTFNFIGWRYFCEGQGTGVVFDHTAFPRTLLAQVPRTATTSKQVKATKHLRSTAYTTVQSCAQAFTEVRDLISN